jgi:hypothetical protein
VNRRGLLTGALATGFLAACGGTEPGIVAADPVHPAVVPAQAEHILAAVDAALDRAFTARNPRLLGARATGPAARALTARLTVAGKLGRSVPAPAPLVLRRLVLPAAGGWPRWFLAAGQAAAQPTPVIRVLRSLGPREPFGLWGELSLLPGASMPGLASPQTGTPVLAADAAQGLGLPPTQVLAQYGKALTTTTPGSQAQGFALDQFREQVAGQLAADRRTLGRIADVDTLHRPSADGLLALRTAEGGALVVAALEQLYEVRVRTPGRGVVTLDTDLAALAGVPRVGHALQRTSVEMLAFHVPPAGKGQVTLVAAAKGDVSAVGS